MGRKFNMKIKGKKEPDEKVFEKVSTNGKPVLWKVNRELASIWKRYKGNMITYDQMREESKPFWDIKERLIRGEYG
jgi:hypothetical protein